MPATVTRPTPMQAGHPPRPTISTHLMLISPRQARAILEDETPPFQRPLRPRHVAFLQAVIERGELRPGTTVSFAVVAGRRYLVNGQHTLTALGQTTGGPLWLQLEEILVADLDAAGRLYETFDRHLARTFGDFYTADAQLRDAGLGPQALAKLQAACTLLGGGLEPRVLGYWETPQAHLLRMPHLRFALMQGWADEMHTCLNGLTGSVGIRARLLRAAVLSIALITYRFQPEEAQVFWPRMVRDSGLVEGEPVHALLRLLRETPAHTYRPARYARLVAACWNAHMDGRRVLRLVGRQEEQPLLLAGTPHTGRVPLVYLTAQGEVVTMPVPVEATVAVI